MRGRMAPMKIALTVFPCREVADAVGAEHQSFVNKFRARL